MTLVPPAAAGVRTRQPPVTDFRLVLLIVGVAVAARAPTFGNPIIHVDEEFYFTVAHAWAHGAIPYVDIWDRKPIGLFALYLPAAALGYPAGIWAYQAMALVAVVATAWIVARLARDAGWGSAAMLAAVAYVLWLNLAEGEGGQTPVFYNLPMVGAAWLILGDRAARPVRALAAMLLAGVAMQIKYSVVFEGLFFGLWALSRHWRTNRCLIATALLGAAMVVVALLPTLCVMVAYAMIGHFDAFWFANFASIFGRATDSPLAQMGNLAILVAMLSPLVAMTVVAWRDSRAAGMTIERTFLFGWLVAAIGGLTVFGGWFDHYALPVILPAAICASGAVVSRAEVRRVAILVLLAVALGGQALLVAKRMRRGTPAEFAALTEGVGSGPGCLFVYSGSAMLYAATGRCRMSRYVFPSHLARDRENGAIGVDQANEIHRILAARPAVIVMRPPYIGERAEIRAIVARTVAARYRLKAALPLGRVTVRIFAATSPS